MAAKRGRKPGVSKVDPNETKAEKFVRLASKRVTKTLNNIRQIGQLSGAGYECTPEQVAKMFGALNAAAETAYNRFNAKGASKSDDGFKF